MPRIPAAILASPNTTGAIGWSLVLILLLVVAVFFLIKLRRWIKEDTDDAAGGEAIGFTLSDFRRLHKEGKMTDEEYGRLRSKMLTGAKSLTENLPDPLARKSPPPPGRPRAARPDEPTDPGNPPPRSQNQPD